jgi:hypothetical protein
MGVARHPSSGQLGVAGVARHPSSGCQTSILRPARVARHPSAEGCQTSIRRPARSGREPGAGSHQHGKAKQARNVSRVWRLAKSPRKAAVADSQYGPHMRKAQPGVNRVSGTCCCSRLCSIERRSNSTVALRQFSRQRDWDCSRRKGLKRPPWSHRGSASGSSLRERQVERRPCPEASAASNAVRPVPASSLDPRLA